jgi:hypothetical protein
VPDNIQIGVDVRDDLIRGFRISNVGVVLVTQKMLDELAECKHNFTSIQPTTNIVSLKQPSNNITNTAETKEDKSLVSKGKDTHVIQ